MYLDFFGLKEAPFSITPDPRFVFLSERHREALAHLLYGVGQGGSGGFVLLTGDIGTGKTTICRLLLEQLPENTQVALVLNPKLTPLELLITIGEELKVEVKGASVSAKKMIDRLNQHLLDQYAAGKRVVLIVDEAQNLSVEALEQIRLLTNLETATQKLLQIILLGQPELRGLIARPELQQLAQRITARYHLAPLDAEETEAYLRHRLAVAGSQRFPIDRAAVKAIHTRARGVPRLINNIADRALLAGFVMEADPVTPALVQRAADEVLGESGRRLSWGMGFALALPILASMVAMAWMMFKGNQSGQTHSSTTTKAATIDASSHAAPDDLSAALLNLPLHKDQKTFEALAKLWHMPDASRAVEAVLRCDWRLDANHRCLRGSGNLAKLQHVGAPVIVLLREGELQRPAVLLGLEQDSVRLQLADQVVQVSRASLESKWFGDWLAVFAMPADFPARWHARESARHAAWVREHLPATANGPDLNAMIRQTQLNAGVLPDGVVGPETQLLLAARDASAPRLGWE